MRESTIRIGGASGYWGDDPSATARLLAAEDLDFLVYDYLAEVTMSIMARARAKDPEAGFAKDFVDVVLRRNLSLVEQRKIRVISNAGGVNPEACGAAIRTLIADLGLNLTVAVVSGDDLLDRAGDLPACRELVTGQPLPPADRLFSINAYLGAFPIAQALDAGADIVVTGRCVDSAVTLGACIHSFGWSPEDLDLLAAGTLAGHILECGTQATGGNFTDWHLVASSLDTIGYPICDFHSDGTFEIGKPADSGGLVSFGTIAEQMLYEIGDPQAYIVPDVVCDFSQVTVTEQAENVVRVSGARGLPPTDSYKLSATYLDGWRAGTTTTFYGSDAADKAKAFCDAVLSRARAALRAANLADFSEVSVEILGAGSQMGTAQSFGPVQEVVVKYAARHPEKAGTDIFLRATSGMGLSAPPGLSGFFGTRARPSPLVRLFSCLLPKAEVAVKITSDQGQSAAPIAPGVPFDPAAIDRPGPPPPPATPNDPVTVPLERLAWGRSGDKGDTANIGIIARTPECLPYIWSQLTTDHVARCFSHVLQGEVSRFFLPGPGAVNFVLTGALGGGGVASLRNDALGKGFAQVLLQTPVIVPRTLIESLT